MSDADIGKKWRKAIPLDREHPGKRVKEHRSCLANRQPIEPETVSELKEAAHRKELAGAVTTEIKHEKTVAERQNQIYDMAFGLVKIAAKKGDLRAAASCLGQAVAITGQMKGSEPSDQNKGASAIIAYVESEKAKE
jgi:hypothetical protein